MAEDNGIVAPIFAIVEFNDGLAIIRRNWATFNSKGEIISSYYPPSENSKKLKRHLLTEDFTPNTEWCNEQGKPYPIKKHIRNAPNYEDAVTKFQIALQVSEVDTDDSVNNKKMKQSRHERHKKRESSDVNSDAFENTDELNVGFSSHIPSQKRVKKRKLENEEISEEQVVTETVEAVEDDKFDEDDKVDDDEDDTAYDDEDDKDDEDDENDESSQTDDQNGTNDSNQIVGPEIPQEGSEEQTSKKEKSQNVKDRGRIAHNSKFHDKPEDIEKWECTEKDIRMFTKLNTIGVMVQFITTHLNSLTVTQEEGGVEEEEELADFPAKTEEEAKLLNSKLNDKSFARKVAKSLKAIGKFRSVSLTVKNALSRLLAPQVGVKYTFLGRSRKKEAFEKTAFYTVVHKTIRQLYSKKVNTNEINRWVKDWLTQCSNTLKRENEKTKKRNKAEEAQKLLNVSDDEDDTDSEADKD